MTMPLEEFITLAAKDAFHTYMDGGDSRPDLSYPSLIYGVSESVLREAVRLKTEAITRNHAQEVTQ
jgi:hypothetical protein